MGINDVEFVCYPNINGKRIKHPAHGSWYSMLKRCFDQSWKKKEPSYNDVTCCDEWLLFSNLLVWFNNNYINTYVLDKDLITRGNKIYSPTTSLFIPVEVNSFLVTSGLGRGDQPLGVYKNGNRYIASISKKSTTHIGSFSDPYLAHNAWQQEKLVLTKALYLKYPNIHGLQCLIDRLELDILQNKETIIL